jgi:predicted ester cyclase
MHFEENKAIVLDFVRMINRGDLSAIDRYISPNFYNYDPKPGELTAQEVLAGLAGDLIAAAPDFQLSVSEFIEEGDTLTFNITMTGTKTNELWGAPGSGKHASWTSFVTSRFQNGQFAFSWQDLPVPEILAVLRQIDLVPTPDQMDRPMKYPVVVPEFLVRVLFTGQVADKECSHLELIQVTEPLADVCNACVEMGDVWPALRMCLLCGFIGCCDTSKNKHMKQHYEETGHPIFRSIRMDEGWIWCYEDNAFFSKDMLENIKS